MVTAVLTRIAAATPVTVAPAATLTARADDLSRRTVFTSRSCAVVFAIACPLEAVAIDTDAASRAIRDRRAVSQPLIRSVVDWRRTLGVVHVEPQAQRLAQVIANAPAVGDHTIGSVRRLNHGVSTIAVVEGLPAD